MGGGYALLKPGAPVSHPTNHGGEQGILLGYGLDTRRNHRREFVQSSTLHVGKAKLAGRGIYLPSARERIVVQVGGEDHSGPVHWFDKLVRRLQSEPRVSLC